MKTPKIIKKIKKFGYPECDHLNNALRFLLKNPSENRVAIEEIYFTMRITNSYFDSDVEKKLYEHFKYYFE